MALGAQRDDVKRLVLGQGMRVGLLGLAIGVGVALAMSQFVDPLLFGVSSRDPGVFTSVTGALLVVVVFASYLPALRAMRVDPMETLRGL